MLKSTTFWVNEETNLINMLHRGSKQVGVCLLECFESPLPVFPSVVVLGVLTKDDLCQPEFLGTVTQPFHYNTTVVPGGKEGGTCRGFCNGAFVLIYTYIHTHIHTYTYTHTNKLPLTKLDNSLGSFLSFPDKSLVLVSSCWLDASRSFSCKEKYTLLQKKKQVIWKGTDIIFHSVDDFHFIYVYWVVEKRWDNVYRFGIKVMFHSSCTRLVTVTQHLHNCECGCRQGEDNGKKGSLHQLWICITWTTI